MSYSTAHDRIARVRGKAIQHKCCSCGGPARQWAYQGSDQELVNEAGLRYSENPDDYAPMCSSCHKRLDVPKTHCTQGHELAGENLSIRPQGWLACKQCRRDWVRAQRAQNRVICECGAESDKHKLAAHRATERHSLRLRAVKEDA